MRATHTAKTVLGNGTDKSQWTKAHVKVKFNDVHRTSKLSLKVDMKARSSNTPVYVNIKVSLLTMNNMLQL